VRISQTVNFPFLGLDIILPEREISALTPNMQHYNWHSTVEEEGNSLVNPNADKTLVLSAVFVASNIENPL